MTTDPDQPEPTPLEAEEAIRRIKEHDHQDWNPENDEWLIFNLEHGMIEAALKGGDRLCFRSLV